MAYSREELLACEGASIPDLIGDDCRLLFVGINPGLQTAMTGIHFAHPSNRFWPALKEAGLIAWLPNVSPIAPSVRVEATHLTTTVSPSNRFYPALHHAGLIDWSVDTDDGMTDEQRLDLIDRGIGISNLVERATVRASELSSAELRSGGERLVNRVEELAPRVVAVAGVSAYRDAFGVRGAVLGPQPEDLGPARLWVVPNPSGLNAHETVASLAVWYRAAADAAGLR